MTGWIMRVCNRIENIYDKYQIFLKYMMVFIFSMVVILYGHAMVKLGSVYFAITGGLFILVTVVYIAIYKKGIECSKLYPVIGIGLGFIYMMLIPMYVVPDEPIHFYTTYEVSNRILGIENTELDSIYMRYDDEVDSIFRARDIDKDYYQAYYNELSDFFIENDDLVTTVYQSLETVSYPYWIGAIGLTVGRLFHLNTLPAFLLGRLFNMIFFVVCVYYSIKKIPFGKSAVFIWAILPMTLQQAMSYSYDSFIFALATVIVSLSLKLAYEEESKKMEWIVLFVAALLMIPIKQFALSPLSFLPILIYFKRWKKEENNAKILKYILVLIGSIILVMLLSKLIPLLSANGATSEEGAHIIEWANEEGYTLSYLLQHPTKIFALIFGTIYQQAEFFLGSMLGYQLGWFEFNMPLVYVLPYAAMLVLAAVRKKGEQVFLGRKTKVFICTLALLGIGFSFAGMLLGHTPISYHTIAGVQGRYFLPFLVMILLCIRTSKIEIEKSVDNQIVFSAVWFQLLIVINVFVSIVR